MTRLGPATVRPPETWEQELPHVHAELSVLEAETAALNLDAYKAAGLLPAQAARHLHPWEVHGAWVAYDRDQLALAAEIAALLLTARALYGRRLVAELRRVIEVSGIGGALTWLASVSTDSALVAGTVLLIEETVAKVAPVLQKAAMLGRDSAIQEAVNQGVRLPASPSNPVAALELAEPYARQSTTSALNGIAQRAATAATRNSVHSELAGDVLTAIESAPTAGVETDLARVPVVKEWGTGRIETIGVLPGPLFIYSSELLDGRGCGPCSVVDGREYETLAGALRDYPDGLYKGCEGGSRCRGTLVAVYEETETP